MIRIHETRIGRYTVKDGGVRSVRSEGLTDEELQILERRAAIAVLSDVPNIEGPELRDARKVLGLKQTELAEYLAVAPETISRWETGGQMIDHSVQLALLFMLDRLHRGEPLTLPNSRAPGFHLRIAC